MRRRLQGKCRSWPGLVLLALALALPVTGVATPVDELHRVRTCVFDPAGQQGPLFLMARDLALEARKWGVLLELQAFLDENVATESFRVGDCDAAFISSLRTRQFVKFAGSMDAIGGLMNYAQVEDFVRLLANPRMGKLMVDGDYEVAGVIPLGAAYVMVNDRAIDSVEAVAGKKIAVLDWDQSQAELVRALGARPVLSDIRDYFGKFNNGQVDVIACPAIAFRPLELHKGLGKKGAIYHFPLVNVTASFVLRRSRLPAGTDIGQRARDYTAARVGDTVAAVQQMEQEIPRHYWMALPTGDQQRYLAMMREARLLLTRDGVYDPRMMSLLKRIRCKHEPGNAECSLPDE